MAMEKYLSFGKKKKQKKRKRKTLIMEQTTPLSNCETETKPALYY